MKNKFLKLFYLFILFLSNILYMLGYFSWYDAWWHFQVVLRASSSKDPTWGVDMQSMCSSPLDLYLGPFFISLYILEFGFSPLHKIFRDFYKNFDKQINLRKMIFYYIVFILKYTYSHQVNLCFLWLNNFHIQVLWFNVLNIYMVLFFE